MRTRTWRGLALASIAAIALSGVTLAYDPPMDDGVLDSAKEVHGVAHHQHGGAAGHITVTNYNVDLVSKLELTTAEGRIADVGVWNGFAYLGAFRQDACGGPESGEPDGGVYVVDITDPADPVQAGFIPIHQDSFAGEGIQALAISTPKFTGDLLVINAESCGKNDKGGFSLYDVTNPYKPMKLVENYGDFNVNLGSRGNDANDIHSAFVWEDDNNTGTEADDRAYVVMTDDFELTDTDIFDITDPRHPFMVGEWNLDATFPIIIDPTLGPISGFLHDMVVKKIGSDYVLLLSYWDSGFVMLNVSDPSNPTLIADTDYADPDPLSGELPEGNG
ncbi:MAG: LVIVD repeat-containing protein, partial [Candidatus Limnocylindria bacterium]